MANDYFWNELDCVEQDRILYAARPLGRYGNQTAAHRYNFYRRRGHATVDAIRYTLAWCRNMAAQRAGRIGHLTGAV